MTIVEYRPAHTIHDDAGVQAVAFLLADPAAPEADGTPVVLISPAGARPDPFDDLPAQGSAAPSPVTDLVGDLPVLDEWIVDLALRTGRVAVLTSERLLFSAPLLPTPPGWTAAVAARGLLDVVLAHEVAVGVSEGLPSRAVRDDGLIAARVPVCLT